MLLNSCRRAQCISDPGRGGTESQVFASLELGAVNGHSLRFKYRATTSREEPRGDRRTATNGDACPGPLAISDDAGILHRGSDDAVRRKG